jgi:hypothetical protein
MLKKFPRNIKTLTKKLTQKKKALANLFTLKALSFLYKETRHVFS